MNGKRRWRHLVVGMLLSVMVPASAYGREEFWKPGETPTAAALYGPLGVARVIAERQARIPTATNLGDLWFGAYRLQEYGPLLVRVLQTNPERRSDSIGLLAELCEMYPRAPWRAQAAAAIRQSINSLNVPPDHLDGAWAACSGTDDVPSLTLYMEWLINGGYSQEWRVIRLLDALQRIGDAQSVSLLQRTLSNTKSTLDIRGAAGNALARMGERSVLNAMEPLTFATRVFIRLQLRDGSDIPRMRKIIEDGADPRDGNGAESPRANGDFVAPALLYLAKMNTQVSERVESRRVLRALLKSFQQGRVKYLSTFADSRFFAFDVQGGHVESLSLWALSSLGDPAALASLRVTMSNPRTIEGMTAVWGWVQLGRPEGWRDAAILVRKPQHGDDGECDGADVSSVSEDIIRLAGRTQGTESLEYLVQVLANRCGSSRQETERALQTRPDRPAVIQRLAALLRSGDEYDQRAAAEVLVSFGRDSVPAFLDILRDTHATGAAVGEALRGLALLDVPETAGALAAARADKRPEVKEALRWADKLAEAKKGEAKDWEDWAQRQSQPPPDPVDGLVDKGQYALALPMVRQGLEKSLREGGEERSVKNLVFAAELSCLAGDYHAAESFSLRALRQLQGNLRVEKSRALSTLARVYAAQGADAPAIATLEDALRLSEKKWGPLERLVARLTYTLGLVHLKRGDSGRAAPLLQRALTIQEALLKPQDPELAETLLAQIRLAREQKDAGRAEGLTNRALALLQTPIGLKHPVMAMAQAELAALALGRGDPTRAEAYLRRALSIADGALGTEHPELIGYLGALARVLIARRLADQAVPLLRRAFALSERRLRSERLAMMGSRVDPFLATQSSLNGEIFSLLLERPTDGEAVRLGLTAALLRKGRSADATAGIFQALAQSPSDEDREQLKQLRLLRSQLATVWLDPTNKVSDEGYQADQQELDRLADQVAEGLTSAKRAGPAPPEPARVLAAVAAALPDDGALIEIVAFSPVGPAASPAGVGPAGGHRYLALVLWRDGRVGAVDLGPTAAIDAAVANLLAVLTTPGSAYLPRAQTLYGLVMQPVVPLLGGRRNLFLSLDGQLNLVPFAVLHDGREPMLDAYRLTYLTSGRDLLRAPSADAPRSVVIVADPDFNAAAGEADDAAAVARRFVERGGQARGSRGNTWHRLSGTLQEANVITRLLPQAQRFLGASATKAALLGVNAPGILHVGTHGWFIEDAAAPAASRGTEIIESLSGGAPLKPPTNALLNSALVLAGANSGSPQGVDGPGAPMAVATALEIANMNLVGTQLVVLSACETGRGPVRLGQGVYGMRRAVMVAGAETLVTSLWKVDDEATGELMARYYGNVLAGQGRVAGMMDAMKALRAQRPHPFYWAPFIVLGQGGPLRGIGKSRR